MYKLKIENIYKTFTGIDEAGRGCLAGPVVAAIVELNPNNIPCGINDSKKLSEKNREKLFKEIMQKSLYVSTGIIYENEIDHINILNASKKAMLAACLNYDKKTNILIDGPYSPCNDCVDFDFICIINGDALSVSIAAASIVAKVVRDKIMRFISQKFSQYGWEKNKGYGTKEHIAAIKKFGITVHHRKTFKPIISIINHSVLF